MLTLNHANLPVADVAPLRDFFVRHFGFTRLNQSDDDAFAVMRGASGFVLNIMRKATTDAGAFPKNFHVGFMVDTPTEVHETHARLVADGIKTGEVESMSRRGVASVTFYCTAPNDILVEVSCYAV